MNNVPQINTLSPSRYRLVFSATKWLTAAALFVAVLSGCVLLDPTAPYAKMPSRTASRHTSAFRSIPQPINGPITLATAIEMSLANNPELAAIRYSVDAASAQRDVVFGAILPRVSVKSGYDHYLDRHRLGPPRYNGEQRVYSDGVFSSDIVLSMPLFAGGRLISEIKAAELLQAASEHRLVRTRHELVFDVSSVFFSILAQHHVIESLEFSQHTLKEHLKRVTELIQVHKAAKVDHLRTEVRIANLEQHLLSERNVLAIQSRVLTNLLGVRQEGSNPLTVSGKLAIGETMTEGLETSLARAISQRSDYLAARATLEAQAKRVDAARAGLWPTLSLQGSYGGRWAAGSVEHPGKNSSSSFDDVGSVGLVLDIPIFEGGRIKARIRRERANLLVAREMVRKLELQISLDVETAILNLSSSLRRVKATEKSIEQAKESLRIEREKYNVGKGAITEVLDAQSALLNSQVTYYRALVDYNTALAQFHLAVGE